MSFDLFPNEVAAQERRATLLGMSAPEPNFWTGFSQAPSLIMQGYAKTARAIDLAGAVGPMAMDAWNGTGTSEQDAYFREHDLLYGSAVDYWTPSPGSVGTAAQIVGTLVPMLTTLPISPALPLLTAGLGTAEDLSKEAGVSAKQAVAAGIMQATGLGLGIYLPAAFGASLAAKVATGAGVNVAQGMATKAGTAAVLQGTEAAKQFNPWDKEGIVIDALMGMGFGALAHLGKPAKELTPTDKAAILVANQARHLEDTTAPGIPKTPVDATAHVDAMKDSVARLAKDQTAEVGQIMQDTHFAPSDAKEAARVEVANEVKAVSQKILMDEVRTESAQWSMEHEGILNAKLREANALSKQVFDNPNDAALMKRYEAVANAAEDMRLVKAKAFFDPVPAPKAPETLAPNKTESDFASRVKAKLEGKEPPAGKPKMQVETDPTVLEAQQRIAQYPDLKMEVKAEDGSTKIVNLADELRTLTEDVQRAQIEAPTLFQTAAACFLGAM